MARTISTSTSTQTAKKRTRKPQHFKATVYGSSEPVIVIAATHKDALKALVTLSVATFEDMRDSGVSNWSVVDTTAAAKPLAFGSQAAAGTASQSTHTEAA